MITTLTGANSYRLNQAKTEVVHMFTHQYGDMAVERLDGNEASFERLQEALQSLPFLVPKKLVVLYAPSANKRFNEEITTLTKGLPDTTDILLVEPKLDKRSSYYKFLKQHSEFQDFAELDQAGLATWLVASAKEQGGLLSSADARYLVEREGLNQLLLSNELAKLLLRDKRISRDTIDALTEPTPQSTIFQLLEAAFAGKTKQTLALYTEQRALKVEPQQIIAMLTWQLHIVALIKAAGDRSPDTIAKQAKVSPYVVRKSQAIARNISAETLKLHVHELLLIDQKSKRVAFNVDEALQLFLIRLTQ